MSETVAAPPTETTQPPTTEAVAAAAPPLSSTVITEPTQPVAPVVPDKYQFAAPEIDGKPIEVDPAALGNFETAARAAGLTQEQFAKIAPLGAQLIQAKVAEAVAAAMPEHLRDVTQADWVGRVKADVEIGGDKLGANLAHAAKAIEKFGGNELREALDLTRAGNNPAIVKAFVAIGKAMDDAGGLLTGRPAAGAKPSNPEQQARDFYNQHGGNYAPVEG